MAASSASSNAVSVEPARTFAANARNCAASSFAARFAVDSISNAPVFIGRSRSCPASWRFFNSDRQVRK
jgi:hypothetical protein